MSINLSLHIYTSRVFLPSARDRRIMRSSSSAPLFRCTPILFAYFFGCWNPPVTRWDKGISVSLHIYTLEYPFLPATYAISLFLRCIVHQHIFLAIMRQPMRYLAVFSQHKEQQMQNIHIWISTIGKLEQFSKAN